MFLNDVKEADINNYDSFANFLCSVLGEEYKVPNDDCCQVFINTFSANKSIIADANFQQAPEHEEYMPLKIKPVVEEGEGEGEGDEEEKTKEEKMMEATKLNLAKLVLKATEYSKDLSKGNEVSRAIEFSRQCEIIFLKHFGFRYMMNDKILGKQ